MKFGLRIILKINKFPFLAVQRGPYSYSEKLKFYLFYKKHLNQTYYFGKDLYFYQKPSTIKRLKHKLKTLKLSCLIIFIKY